MSIENIRAFNNCISAQERKQRIGVAIVSILLWPLAIAIIAMLVLVTCGLILLAWLLKHLLAEYQVRKLQALGATVSPEQLPEVWLAAQEVADRFNIKQVSQIIVIASGETNAFAVNIARKKVIVLLSELLEGVIDHPAELRALLAHEMCHHELDFGWRRFIEIYKPAKFKAARELTCDNAGYVAAGDVEAAKSLLRKVCVGKDLHERLSEEALVAESKDIYFGFVGWLIKQYLTHPPAGARIANVVAFAERYPAMQTVRV